jgi:hypothetical protein
MSISKHDKVFNFKQSTVLIFPGTTTTTNCRPAGNSLNMRQIVYLIEKID